MVEVLLEPFGLASGPDRSGRRSMLTIPASLPAAADPPLTVDEAKAQIAQLETEAAAIDQEYVGVKERSTQSKAQLEAQAGRRQGPDRAGSRGSSQVGQVALAQFQNRNLDTAAQLFVTDDTDGFLSQISTVEKVSENQNSALQDYQEEQAKLAELERSTETDLAALAEQEKPAQGAADVLRREDRRGEDRAGQADRGRAASVSPPRSRRPARRPRPLPRACQRTPTSTAPALRACRRYRSREPRASPSRSAQLGKPYRFAAAGPNAYDCSGLTSAAWKAAGVTLPRTSRAQFGVGRYVAKSDLQPGDLVFFYSSTAPSHVALYVGNGMVIHAPHPGSTVRYIKMKYMPYSGARRPG